MFGDSWTERGLERGAEDKFQYCSNIPILRRFSCLKVHGLAYQYVG